MGSFVVVVFTAVDGNFVTIAVTMHNTAVAGRGIIVERTILNRKGRVVVHENHAVAAYFIIVDFGAFDGNNIIIVVGNDGIARILRKCGITDMDITVAICVNTSVGHPGKGQTVYRNICIRTSIYATVHAGQRQGLAGQYQRVMGRFCAIVHLNAVGRAGEDTAGAACFIIGGRFIGQGKGVGVLTVGQGYLAGEGIAVQVQGDGVIHGGSRDLLAHIGQQVDAGVAPLILGRIQRGLQGGEVLGAPIEDGTAV